MSSDSKFFIGVVVAAVVILGGLIFFTKKDNVTPGSKAVDQTELAAGVFRGPSDAKVTVVEFSDFQCPACYQAEPNVRQLIKNNPGVKFVYRYFPIPSHKYGKLSAQAGAAAALQNKFWEMHDLLFDKQPEWSASTNVQKLFEDYAQLLGLNVETFKKDLVGKPVLDAVTNDDNYGISIGVDQTPTFFINGKKITGVQSVDNMQKEIDAAAAAAQ